MIIEAFAVGRFFANCYVVGCERKKEAIIVDPGFDDRSEFKNIINFIDQHFSNLRLIVNTHGHPDHTCGNGIVKKEYGAPILIHQRDANMLGGSADRIAALFALKSSSPRPDMYLCDGDILEFGEMALKVVHTPGHSPGSISLVGEKSVFTGDTLFAGSIGRVDFPESSSNDMKTSLRKLTRLPDCLVVYPGHGPKTTVGEEKNTNPFLRSLNYRVF